MPARLTIDAADVVTRYEDGATVAELAAHYGCSTMPIRRILREAGVTLRRGGAKPGDASLHRSLTPAQEEDVVRLYVQERISGSAIARKYGVVAATVLGALRRRGVAIRRRSVDDATLRALAERYQAGEKLTVLAREVGYRRAGLYEALKTLGVDMRPRGRPPTSLSDPRMSALLADVKAGRTVAQASADAGVSPPVATRLLRESGYELRSGGTRHSQWNGGRFVDANGYVRVWVAADDPMASMRNSRGYVPEHRLVLARSLGRPLASSEQVHHINGDKHDNRPENLQLRTGNHGSGTVLICRACGSHDIGTAPI